MNDLTPEMIANDPAASFWLKQALASALLRDPVDAANDAAALVAALDHNAAVKLQEAVANLNGAG